MAKTTKKEQKEKQTKIADTEVVSTVEPIEETQVENVVEQVEEEIVETESVEETIETPIEESVVEDTPDTKEEYVAPEATIESVEEVYVDVPATEMYAEDNVTPRYMAQKPPKPALAKEGVYVAQRPY